jgi:SpoVK/Ycf46/Vps4 family AAA+-type ATPase
MAMNNKLRRFRPQRSRLMRLIAVDKASLSAAVACARVSITYRRLHGPCPQPQTGMSLKGPDRINRLRRLAQEILPKARWEQLILPKDSIQQLRELCTTVRTRSLVPEENGFGSRGTRGQGVTALFAGIPGTGKTMAAEVIANELGVPLFRVDLAEVVSKWIGETEKNLDAVFEAASDSNAILFFDEADALFGKPTEVKDSHHRNANLEISYILQKMECYEGVAILATNMRQQLDDVRLRRPIHTVIFP